MNSTTPAQPQEAEHPSTSMSLRWLELGLIVLLFFLFVGPLTPEVNEPHYLSKARHYWNPQWCPEDHFLNSGDAHGVFYWSFGWITTLVSFPVAAWIGRVICWIGIAVSWQRMIAKIDNRPWIGFLAMAAGLAGINYLHMAGEWLIGGVEAKCFAYAIAFWAIGDALSQRWNRAWILLGVASAFHVLVGGWMVVCLMISWLLCPQQRASLRSMLPGLFLGGAISLVGVVPLLLLNREATDIQSNWASYYYVYERLSHHLVVHTFSDPFKWRFSLATVGWAITAWILRNEDKLRVLNGIVAGSVVLVLIGVAIDQWFFNIVEDWLMATKLLRLYWYRIADIMVPLALALNVILLLQRIGQDRPKLTKVGYLGLSLLVGLGMIVRIADRWTATASPADRSSLVSDPNAWIQTCHWVRENTDSDAICLTPRLQSSFKWYAERAEVVTTKDVPQDDVKLLEWRERRGDTHWRSVHSRNTLSLAGLTEEDIRELAATYGFRYVIVDRKLANRDEMEVSWSFPKLYPTDSLEKASYEVYEVTSADD